MFTHTIARGAAALLVCGLATALPVATAPVGFADDTDDTGAVDTDYGRLLLLLDSSGSMKEPASGGVTKIQAARSALTTVVDGLPDDADVGLRVFGATVFSRDDAGACKDTQLVVEPETDNRDELRSAIKSYKPYGETPIPAALRAAAKDLGDEGKRSIVLVSDGESTCAPDPCKVAEEVSAQGIDLQIDVVGLSVSGKARNQLRCIANKGGGSYYDADDADDLEKSLDRIADRAVQPFTVQGQKVTGTATSADAPAIGSGQYVDQIPAEGEGLYYRVERTIPGSTLWVGVAAQPGVSQQLIELRLETTTGAACGYGQGYNSVTNDGAADLVLAAVHSKTDGEKTCADDDLLLRLEKAQWSTEAGSAPMQLTVVEEPPVDDVDSLPEALDEDAVWQDLDTSGDPKETSFGTTFLDAPVLDDGLYRSTIVPGEVQLYRVPLAWGQRLQAELRTHATSGLDDVFGALAPTVDVHILSPVGAPVDETFPKNADGGVLSPTPPIFPDAKQEAVGRRVSHEVRYRNRENNTSEEHAAIAGDYYVLVEMASDSDGDSAVVPYDLALGRFGTEDSGEPGYAGDADIKGADAADQGSEDSADDSAAGSQRSTDADDDGPGAVKLVAGGTVGALGLGSLVLGLWLFRRRARA